MVAKQQSKTKKVSLQFRLIDFLKLINSASPKKSLFLLGIFLSVITSAASLVVPQLSKNLVDTNTIMNLDSNVIILIALALIVQLVFGTLGGFILRYVGENAVQNLRIRLWNHLLLLPVNYFDDRKAGASSSRLVNDTAVLKDLVTSQFPGFLTGSIQLIGSMIILFIMDYKMAALLFSVIPVIVAIILPLGKLIAKIGKQVQSATADFNGDASEKLTEIRLIKSSNGENFEKSNGASLIGKIFQLGIKDAKIEAILQPILLTVLFAAIVGILGYGFVRVSNNTLTLGTLVAFLLYIFNIITPVATFATFFSQVQKAMGSTERIQQILLFDKESVGSIKDVDISGLDLVSTNVNFGYNENQMILNDFNFEAKSNSVVAFVGPSGSGKSTVLALIERFYKPNSGYIKIGNYDIQDININEWRSQIGYVSQDSAVFAGSIKFNLTYGLYDNVSDEKLWEALELAYAKDFVENFKDKLDTEIGERGLKLSGGQKQRIAIARAFLRNPKILMLDEATASLDSQSEYMVQKALDKLMVNRTTIVIAHRLSTIVNADNIYFIENGHVTGSGNHSELLKTHKLYAKYVKEQMI
ncbi:ABC transporter ATP-binding protein [Mycoplasma sp. P36-A1]|uniref:ABC transporter ATP-binding protein n=1 Tax=Mycoplasma sp. P36-A1 TaxID=3252900 RepID=UPI003C2B0D8B